MIVNNVDTKDISVVVQGPICENWTRDCLVSIRKYLPESTIILSTWEGSNVDGLDYDKLVLNKDPGAFPSFIEGSENNRPNNINRQILSTKNGLKKVKTKYAMKMRTDFVLCGNNFLKYFKVFDKYLSEKDLKLFNDRVLMLCFQSIELTPFWIGDFVFFGSTDDLMLLWGIPLQSKEDIAYFNTHKPVNNVFYQRLPLLPKFMTEQYIVLNAISKVMPKIFERMRDFTDNSKENFELSEKILVNNFCVLDSNQFSVNSLKKILFDYLETRRCFKVWINLYKKHCDKSYKIPLKYKNIKATLCIEKDLEKFNKHLNKVIKPFFILFKPFVVIFSWFIELLRTIIRFFGIVFKCVLNFWKIFY